MLKFFVVLFCLPVCSVVSVLRFGLIFVWPGCSLFAAVQLLPVTDLPERLEEGSMWS